MVMFFIPTPYFCDQKYLSFLVLAFNVALNNLILPQSPFF
jgi:hypothetical protein